MSNDKEQDLEISEDAAEGVSGGAMAVDKVAELSDEKLVVAEPKLKPAL